MTTPPWDHFWQAKALAIINPAMELLPDATSTTGLASQLTSFTLALACCLQVLSVGLMRQKPSDGLQCWELLYHCYLVPLCLHQAFPSLYTRPSHSRKSSKYYQCHGTWTVQKTILPHAFTFHKLPVMLKWPLFHVTSV